MRSSNERHERAQADLIRLRRPIAEMAEALVLSHEATAELVVANGGRDARLCEAHLDLIS